MRPISLHLISLETLILSHSIADLISRTFAKGTNYQRAGFAVEKFYTFKIYSILSTANDA